MRSHLLLSLLLVLLLLPSPALAKGKKGAGKNHHKPTREELFKKLDLNQDQQLTLGEFIGRRTGDKAARAEQMFKRLDTNGDELLSFDEFKLPPKKGKKGA